VRRRRNPGQRAHLESEEELDGAKKESVDDKEAKEESEAATGWDCLGRRQGLLERHIIWCSSPRTLLLHALVAVH
jgi:hypothetical protein